MKNATPTARSRSVWIAILAATAAISLAAAELVGAAAPQPTADENGGVELRIAAVLDAPTPTLAFTVTNRSRLLLEDRGVGVHNNRVEILTPSGRLTAYAVSVGGFADTTPFIQPGETVTRTIRADNLSSRMGESGTYRIYWDFEGLRSPEFRLYRENDGDLPQHDPANDLRDQSTPKAALKSLLKALDSGDTAMVGRAVENDGLDPVQRAIHGALVQRTFASDNFRKHLELRFGKRAGQSLVLMAPLELLDAIDKAEVTFPEHFLEATLQVGEKRYRFLRGWQLAASNFTRNGQPDVDDIKRQTKVLNETAEEVRTGKFKTRAEAIDRVRQRLNLPIAA